MAAPPSHALPHILLFNAPSSSPLVPTRNPFHPSWCGNSVPLSAPLSAFLVSADSVPAARFTLRFGIPEFPADWPRGSRFRVRAGGDSTSFRRGIHVSQHGLSSSALGLRTAHLGLRVSRCARSSWQRGRGGRGCRGRASEADYNGEKGGGETNEGHPPEDILKTVDTAEAAATATGAAAGAEAGGEEREGKVRAKIRERTKVAMSDPNIRARLKERGHRQSVQTRALIAAKLRANWQRRHEQLALVAALQRAWRGEHSEEHRKRISDAIKAKWADPEYRSRVASAIRLVRPGKSPAGSRSKRAERTRDSGTGEGRAGRRKSSEKDAAEDGSASTLDTSLEGALDSSSAAAVASSSVSAPGSGDGASAAPSRNTVAKAAKASTAAAAVVVIPNPDEAFVELEALREGERDRVGGASDNGKGGGGGNLTFGGGGTSDSSSSSSSSRNIGSSSVREEGIGMGEAGVWDSMGASASASASVPALDAQQSMTRHMVARRRKQLAERARVLMAEAEQAAQALAAVAGRDNRAMASLLETRRLLDEARRAVTEAEGLPGGEGGVRRREIRRVVVWRVLDRGRTEDGRNERGWLV
ncbi:hypothetical protein CLOM_g9297 [Closterium sp. NIES-68]|nr:hypothetical protein CLOM_g9297 [Closterium sp. NIES-68]GJP79932.1 hypothetical protein CLOP_g10146 [Closterium sp. NIES-67]